MNDSATIRRVCCAKCS